MTTEFVEKKNVTPNENVTRYYNIDCKKLVLNNIWVNMGVSGVNLYSLKIQKVDFVSKQAVEGLKLKKRHTNKVEAQQFSSV